MKLQLLPLLVAYRVFTLLKLKLCLLRNSMLDAYTISDYTVQLISRHMIMWSGHNITNIQQEISSQPGMLLSQLL